MPPLTGKVITGCRREQWSVSRRREQSLSPIRA